MIDDLYMTEKIFIDNNRINSFDERGWYITEIKGTFYLYDDGIIRIGTDQKNDNSAFWKTKKDAEDFFKSWKENEFDKNHS